MSSGTSVNMLLRLMDGPKTNSEKVLLPFFFGFDGKRNVCSYDGICMCECMCVCMCM